MKKGIDCSFVSPRGLVTIFTLFFISQLTFSQARPNISVFPQRVTEGVMVTIEFTGNPDDAYFDISTLNSIRFLDGGMNVQKRDLVGKSRMTFEIGRNNTTTTVDPTYSNPNVDIVRELQFNGPDGTLEDTGIEVQYIAPLAMIHAINDLEGRIQVNPRVSEIYTDYGGVKQYSQDQEFTRGADINSTKFGRWEFFNVDFRSNPSGVLLETGGRGRGMFIGFVGGNLVIRGGDGRPPGTPTPAGCARIVITPAEYDFENKNGRLLMTMDPSNGELTFEFDDGVTVFSKNVTATAGYLGYDSFREWSGGNQGFVGRSNGNIAGDEISGNAPFSGTIEVMEFSNYENPPIAWRSSFGRYPGNNNPDAIIPDNYHDLIGFKYNGVVYSTGANDGRLEEFLGSEIIDNMGNPLPNYVRQRFKAYSTSGVDNITIPQHHIFTGEFVDGKAREGTTEFKDNPTDPNDPDYELAFENIRGLSMFEVLIDGENGLNIGSGINNLNRDTSIRFFSGNGEFGGVSDGIPDLLIPNLAEAGGTDLYYYAGPQGDVIGRPISIRINNSDSNNPPLSHWQNDQYRVTNPVPFDDAVPDERIYGIEQERPMRLIAFTLEDFGITGWDPDNDPMEDFEAFTDVSSIDNINAGAGGTADVAFFAYNTKTFKLKSPVVKTRPIPRSICNIPEIGEPSNISVTFEIAVNVERDDDDPPLTQDDVDAFEFEWRLFSNVLGQTTGTLIDGDIYTSYTINNVDKSDRGIYKIFIKNAEGQSRYDVELSEGGTTARWNGTDWVYGTGFVEIGGDTKNGQLIEVADSDRRLVFSEEDWDNSDWAALGKDVLEGCECDISAGYQVTIPNGKAMRLSGQMQLRPEVPILDDDEQPTGDVIPAGQLIIEDGGSLVQTKATDLNDNIGDIEMRRETADLNDFDYVFWSSPVDGFNLSDVGDPAPSLSYYWDATAPNPNGTEGNWVFYNGVMAQGRGYISRTDDEFGIRRAAFKGVPNNGRIEVAVDKTGDVIDNDGITLPEEDRSWNLIGNPYPSAIDAEQFLTNTNNAAVVDGFINVWESDNSTLSSSNPSPYYENQSYSYSDAYLTYNKMGSSEPNSFDGDIASGQAFFVRLLPAATEPAVVEFTNSMRFKGSNQSIIDNSGFLRTGARTNETAQETENDRERIWLNIINKENVSSSTLIGYAQGATLERDRLYDALYNKGAGELSIYSVLDGGSMVIQGRPLPFNELDEVPLGVEIPSTGVYRVGIDKLDGDLFLNEQTNIILEDTYTGTLHDLRIEPFNFQSEQGTYNDRFILRYTADQLSTKDVETPDAFAYIKYDRLHVQSNKVITGIQVYDISGKLVLNYELKSNDIAVETDFNYARGAYIVLIELEDSITVSKKLLN